MAETAGGPLMALAISAVLAVLVAQFKSFRGPLAIVLAVPLGLSGVPVALGLGGGAGLQRPLALAVIGGLTVSAAVTLLVLPTLLDSFGGLRHRMTRHIFAEPQNETSCASLDVSRLSPQHHWSHQRGDAGIGRWRIACKRMGRFDTRANLGYTIVGRPAGAQLKNIFNLPWPRR